MVDICGSERLIGARLEPEEPVDFENVIEEWNNMVIEVVEPWGSIHILTVGSHWKINLIKQVLQTLTGVCCEEQQLSYAGRELPGHCSVEGAGLYDRCKVSLAVRSRKLTSPLVQLFIKPLTGTRQAFWVKPSCTVEQLKELLHCVLGAHADEQRLIFAGQVLESEYTLHDYGLKRGFTLYLSLKKRAHVYS